MGYKHPEMLGLGYCGLDYLCLVPRIPLDDKVEVIQSLIQGGGPAATATVAVARLGGSAGFVGAVGDDDRGRTILSGLSSAGVDTDSIIVCNQCESPSAYCWVEESTGKRSIAWHRGSLRSLSPDDIDEDLIAAARVLHLDGHHTQAAIRAAEIARNNDVTVSLDAGTILPGIEVLIELADIVIASEKFAVTYTAQSDAEEALKSLFTEDCRFAAVTSGSAGCIGFDGQTLYHQPAFDVQVVDTTGAGDVFHGAFLYRFLEQADWQECMRFASAVSALKCTRLGGRTGIPTLSDAELFLQENG